MRPLYSHGIFCVLRENTFFHIAMVFDLLKALVTLWEMTHLLLRIVSFFNLDDHSSHKKTVRGALVVWPNHGMPKGISDTRTIVVSERFGGNQFLSQTGQRASLFASKATSAAYCALFRDGRSCLICNTSSTIISVHRLGGPEGKSLIWYFAFILLLLLQRAQPLLLYKQAGIQA